MSTVFHDHSNEGFDEEWAKAMKPTWDKLAEERKALKAIPEEELVPAYKLFEAERKNAIQHILANMIKGDKQ